MTETAHPDPTGQQPPVGALLRAARRSQNLTLQELSTRSGLSVGYLSQIERDIATPSLGSLNRLAAALSLDLGHFIPLPNARGLVTRKQDRETIWVREGGMTYERLHGEFVGAAFSAFLITMPAGFVTETDIHTGEEFVEVRSGRVIFTIGERDYDLQAGDTLHFNSDQRHQARNPEGDPAVLFWLGNGPTFQMTPQSGTSA
ncbi:helix-turn-helix domain-containing protein [Thalassorhabdomicrobium marinisediminis]|uniref:XRE family transcriptional regulator n=1 Tax=Thalassorhabdomicrobium marinisediminis TaxID=2170577 RepID=A0A2T7FTI6_9RHOB|nr:XRE family transcriptional regulator [Thalassorhabdomicrobium marinisediminis]PVA05481.1 XRE family transcriptional regulator [Thalassorhabdomicrobium marinisediminis]